MYNKNKWKNQYPIMKNSKVNKEKKWTKGAFHRRNQSTNNHGNIFNSTIKKMQTKAIIKYHLTLNRLANESCLTTTSK